jgi:hypothetical protein
MIVNVSLRLLYLIFDQLLGWLLPLARTPACKTSNCSSCATRSLSSAEPTPIIVARTLTTSGSGADRSSEA